MVEYERVIAISDIHLGWEAANTDLLLEFLETEVPRRDPDAIALCGDILELWRRGIASVPVDFSPQLNAIERLWDDGVDVLACAGNHDTRLLRMNDSGRYEVTGPYQWSEEIPFESGGREFIALHGHQADAANRSRVQAEALCLTSDETGQAIADSYSEATGTATLLETATMLRPLFTRPNLGALNHLANPNILAEPQYAGAVRNIRQRLERRYDRYVIYGHTHIPGVQEESANCGTWARGTNTFLEIVNGEVALYDYTENGSQPRE